MKIPVSQNQFIRGEYANRHGLIAGATGTGKTVTLQKIIEGMSDLGTVCFVADVKGDLAGLKMDGRGNARPTRLWDVYAELGRPFTLSLASLGPDILSRMLGLTDAQQGVIEDVFEEGNPIANLDDLIFEVDGPRMIVGDATRKAVVRAIKRFQRNGGGELISSQGFRLDDIYNDSEKGRINILEAGRISRQPQTYAMLMVWFLRELSERMPEVGDLDAPLFSLFIDEAHLLFADGDKELIRSVAQTVRLIRSKGVGVYFVTQSPDDLPAEILGQLGNRVQHALRGATQRDQKAIKAAAETMASNPTLDAATEIGRLQTGEALVSFLDATGAPSPVEKVKVTLPDCRLGALTVEERGIETTTVRLPKGIGKYGFDFSSQSADLMFGIPLLIILIWMLF